MSVERWPVRWAGKTVVVDFPAEIDVNNAGPIRALLMSLVEESGAQVVIVDMAPSALIDSTVVVATTTSPACSGRLCAKLCSLCTTIE